MKLTSCVFDMFSKYAWVVPLKNKKGIAMPNFLHKSLGKFIEKLKKMWVHNGSQLYIKWMKSRLQDNDIEIFSTQ